MSMTQFELVVGLGCQRGISCESILTAILSAQRKIEDHLANSTNSQIYCLASITCKETEHGLLAALSELGYPLFLYSEASLEQRQSLLHAEQNTSCSITRPAVAEPAALLAAHSVQLLLPKWRFQGTDGKWLTIAMSIFNRSLSGCAPTLPERIIWPL